MFKDVLNHANLTLFAELGLLIFFIVFVGIAFRTFTRPRRQVEEWSELPLSDDAPLPARIKEPRS